MKAGTMINDDDLSVRYILTEAERKYSVIDRLPAYLESARAALETEAARQGKVVGDLVLVLRATVRPKP